MNWFDLKARYDRSCATIRDLAAGRKIEERFLPAALACQYDANVAMVDDIKSKNLTIDDIPVGMVRPGISLEVLRPPTAEEVPVPVVDAEQEPTDVEPFTTGKRGSRNVGAESRQYATEKAKLPKLPEHCSEGPALTLFEVEVYHKQYHKPLGAKTRVVQSDEDHLRPLKLTACDRRDQEKSAVKRVDDAAIQSFNYERQLFEATQQVKVSMPAPENVIERTSDAVTSFVMVDDQYAQMYEQSAEEGTQRLGCSDVLPNWPRRWSDVVPGGPPAPPDESWCPFLKCYVNHPPGWQPPLTFQEALSCAPPGYVPRKVKRIVRGREIDDSCLIIGDDVERDAANSYAAAAQYVDVVDADDALVMVEPPPIFVPGPMGYTRYPPRRPANKQDATTSDAPTGSIDVSVESTDKADAPAQAATAMFSDDDSSVVVELPENLLAADAEDEDITARTEAHAGEGLVEAPATAVTSDGSDDRRAAAPTPITHMVQDESKIFLCEFTGQILSTDSAATVTGLIDLSVEPTDRAEATTSAAQEGLLPDDGSVTATLSEDLFSGGYDEDVYDDDVELNLHIDAGDSERGASDDVQIMTGEAVPAEQSVAADVQDEPSALGGDASTAADGPDDVGVSVAAPADMAVTASAEAEDTEITNAGQSQAAPNSGEAENLAELEAEEILRQHSEQMAAESSISSISTPSLAAELEEAREVETMDVVSAVVATMAVAQVPTAATMPEEIIVIDEPADDVRTRVTQAADVAQDETAQAAVDNVNELAAADVAPDEAATAAVVDSSVLAPVAEQAVRSSTVVIENVTGTVDDVVHDTDAAPDVAAPENAAETSEAGLMSSRASVSNAIVIDDIIETDHVDTRAGVGAAPAEAIPTTTSGTSGPVSTAVQAPPDDVRAEVARDEDQTAVKQRLLTLQPPTVPVIGGELVDPAVLAAASGGNADAPEPAAKPQTDDESVAYYTASSSPMSLATTASYFTALTTPPWLQALDLSARRPSGIHRDSPACVDAAPTPSRGVLVAQWLDKVPLDRSSNQRRDSQSHD